MMEQAEILGQTIGIATACEMLAVPRSSLYYARKPVNSSCEQPQSARSLSAEEREAVYQVLNSERFQDQSPRHIYATLLDEGHYLCSWRTMYRILEAHEEVKERRRGHQRTNYARPELLARGPNELWSWDITKLKGPVTWTYFYLYVILDVFSRYVVGWLVAEHESAQLAKQLIEESCERQAILPDQLTLHADRGSSMRSKPVALLLSDLGVTKTHSRPYTSNDNPYSEAQFKTLKYRPDFPERFGSLMDARGWAQDFFQWYNHDHYHAGLNLMTPATVHYGQFEQVQQQRNATLWAAYLAHPERFVKGVSSVNDLPDAVWINKPKQPSEEQMLFN